jgi:hypothetical protein
MQRQLEKLSRSFAPAKISGHEERCVLPIPMIPLRPPHVSSPRGQLEDRCAVPIPEMAVNVNQALSEMEDEWADEDWLFGLE